MWYLPLAVALGTKISMARVFASLFAVMLLMLWLERPGEVALVNSPSTATIHHEVDGMFTYAPSTMMFMA